MLNSGLRLSLLALPATRAAMVGVIVVVVVAAPAAAAPAAAAAVAPAPGGGAWGVRVYRVPYLSWGTARASA